MTVEPEEMQPILQVKIGRAQPLSGRPLGVVETLGMQDEFDELEHLEGESE